MTLQGPPEREDEPYASLQLRLRTSLSGAMRRRDAVAVAATRSALGAIDNAGRNDCAPRRRSSPPNWTRSAVPGSDR